MLIQVLQCLLWHEQRLFFSRLQNIGTLCHEMLDKSIDYVKVLVMTNKRKP